VGVETGAVGRRRVAGRVAGRVALGACLLLPACGDGTGPLVRPPDAVDVTMEFCPGDAPLWIAYRNEGQPWVRAPHAPFQASFTFPATPRVTVAYARSNSSASTVFVWNMESADVELFRCRQVVDGGRVQMTGSAKLIESDDQVALTTGSLTQSLDASDPAFSLLVPSDAPFDLIAVLTPAVRERPQLAIVRRSQTGVDDGVVPMLDFTSGDARPLATARVTIGDAADMGSVFGEVEFRSTGGAVVPFRALIPVAAAASARVQSLAPEQTLEGDEHRVTIRTSSFSPRELTYRTAALRDTTVALGPDVPDPEITVVERTPFQRVALHAARQTEYGSFARAAYQQRRVGIERVVVVTTTAAYAGSASSWNLDVPDFTEVPDFPMAWAFQDPFPGLVQLLVTDEPLAAFLGAVPAVSPRRLARTTTVWE
jgi:hypothetical protein